MANPFERAVARINPPPRPNKRTSFSAANTSRLSSDWIFASSRSADSELRYELKVMRNRSRELVRNSPFGKRYQQVIAEKVVGPFGFKLKAKNVLKDGSDLHHGANKAIQDAFAEWSKAKNSDVTKRLTLTSQLQLAASNWGTDGEILARFYRGKRFGPFGLAIQWLDPDFLNDELNQEPIGDRPTIRQGVELDEYGAPVAYYLFTRHPNDASIDRQCVRVPASDILHAFMPVRIGQSRGIPHGHAIEMTLKMLDGYIEAELVAARVASSSMGAIVDATEDGSAPAVNPNAGGGQDGAAGFEGTGGDTFGSGGDIVTEAEPGAMLDLRGKAAKLQLWDPQHPTSAFPDFTRMMAHFAAMGLGFSYGTLTGDLSQANYGSLRVGMLDERDHWQCYQQFMIDHVMERIFDEWIRAALLNSMIRSVTDFDAERWSRKAFRPRGFPWIDPLKDVQGDLLEVGAGVNTLTRIAAAQGDDFEELLEERAEEIALLEEYGVPSVLATTISDRPTQPATEESGDGADASSETGGTASGKSGDDADGFARALPIRAFISPRPRRAARG